MEDELMAVSPVLPDTVKLEVSTAMPPSRLTRVVVVAPLPVTVARVEVSAIVTVPEALLVVVMSVPAAIVTVPPWLIVELVPVVAARVKSVPPETTQVEQPMSPKAESVTGAVAETATVPEALGIVIVLSAVGSVRVRKVSKVLAVEPSKIKPLAPKMMLLAASAGSPERAVE